LRKAYVSACPSAIFYEREQSMRYAMPNQPCEFELPDDWLAESGLVGDTLTATAYCSTATAMLVPLREIEPPFRSQAHPKDWRGFDRARLVNVMKGIAERAEIEPVPLIELPPGDRLALAPYRYRVRDGFHRFYASVAAGFGFLPATVVSMDDLLALSKELGWRT
jgi:hypothetical protein